MGLSASSVLGEVSGIASLRLIRGEADFAKFTGRYNILLGAAKRGYVPKIKTPLPIEMIGRDIDERKRNSGSNVAMECIAGSITSFPFLLRGRELANLRMRRIPPSGKQMENVSPHCLRPNLKLVKTERGVSILDGEPMSCVCSEEFGQVDDQGKLEPYRRSVCLRKMRPQVHSTTLAMDAPDQWFT